MRTIDQVILRGRWKNWYDSFSKKMLDDEDYNEMATAFNSLFKEELIRNQKANVQLSQEDVYRICGIITRRVYDLGVVDITDFNINAVKNAMVGVQIVSTHSCIDHMGRDYDFVHLHCLGHIELKGLTDKEISFFIDAFGGDIEEQWGYLIFKVLDIKINDYVYCNRNIHKIENMCRNAVYDKVNDMIFERYNVDIGYKTKILDRIKDFFILRSI
ncbi:hypothetical protein ACI2KR_07360 [Pseudomonas luteola]